MFTLQLGGGVGAAGRHLGVHGAAQGRVQQGGKPAAVHRAHGVEVLLARSALEHGGAVAHLHDGEVQRLRDGRVRQGARQHALHHLQPGFAGDLVGAGPRPGQGLRPGLGARRLLRPARRRVWGGWTCSAPQNVVYATIVDTMNDMPPVTIASKSTASKPSDPSLKPQGCTYLKLRQLTRSVARLYDEQLARCGLKGTQYSLLSHAVKLGPVAGGGPGGADEPEHLHAVAQPAAAGGGGLAGGGGAGGGCAQPPDRGDRSRAGPNAPKPSACGAWRRSGSTNCWA